MKQLLPLWNTPTIHIKWHTYHIINNYSKYIWQMFKESISKHWLIDVFLFEMDRGTESPFQAEPQGYMSKNMLRRYSELPGYFNAEKLKATLTTLSSTQPERNEPTERRGTVCQLHTASREKWGVERSCRKLWEWVISSGSLGSAWL